MATSSRISNSFSEGEVTVLAEIVSQIQRGGGQFSVITRHKDFPVLARKVLQMRAKSQKKKQEVAASGSEDDSE